MLLNINCFIDAQNKLTLNGRSAILGALRVHCSISLIKSLSVAKLRG